ncbi:MAG: terminase small subunit [Ruminococcus sp.]|nr:terminase small subunit [Ruminococcus sp.]
MPANSIKTQKELFCCWYAALGCVEEAALRAGFPHESALAKGLSLLKDPGCRRRISAFSQALSQGGSVTAGLRRLAFGSCADAVSLAFADELSSPGAVKGLDLFCVSEIKRDKGGGVEIRLFDRLKALEKLYELERMGSEGDTARSLIDALTAPAEEGISDEDQ